MEMVETDVKVLQKELKNLKEKASKLSFSRFVSKEFKRHELRALKKQIASEEARIAGLMKL